MRARRLHVVDEYVEAGQAAVYSEAGVVVLLSELATVAWSALSTEWSSAESVAVQLVAALGSPDPGTNAVSLTESTLLTLADHGIVEVDDGV
jgi:hypothetical protein